MKVSSQWDTISEEWVTGMKISFTKGYSTIKRVYNETGKINITTVNTFLTLLAQFPDTFIARKVGVKVTKDIPKAVEIGLKKAEKISRKAATIIRMGGLKTAEGKKALLNFDRELRLDHKLNPGTTADLTATSLLIAIICGLRP
jgi:triphosphoribosyl-dephospho-CoA synthase